MYTKTMFRKIRYNYGDRAASSESTGCKFKIASTDSGYAGTIFGQNFDITIMATTGNVSIGYESTLSTANGILLTEGTIIDLTVEKQIYLMAGSTAPQFQAIIWE